MPTCKDCHLENLEWGETKDGKPMLYEVRRIPHFAVCKAKQGSKIARSAKKGMLAPAEAMLKEMGYPDYAELLRDIPEGPAETMVLAALKKKGRE